MCRIVFSFGGASCCRAGELARDNVFKMQVAAGEPARPDDITKERILKIHFYLVTGYCNCSGNFVELACIVVQDKAW